MDNVWTNLGNRLETAWKRPTRPNSKRPKDGEIIDEEKSVRWNREEVVRRQKAWDAECSRLKKAQNAEIEHIYLATLREAVFYRDNYTCQVCGRKIADGAILHMHHMFYWKGRHGYQLDELVTACEKCHTPANHQKGGKLFGFGEDKEFANLSGAAFMNAVRWQIVDALHATYGKEFVTITYGAMTKEKRIILGIEKTHNNDAYAMGDYHPVHRCVFRHYQKRRRNNRVLEKFYDATYIDTRTGNKAKGKELFNGRISRNHKKDSENLHKYRSKKVSKGRRSIRRQRYAIQPYDTVRLEGKTYITSGCHNKGTRLLIPANGKSKSVAISKVQVVCHAGAWIQII